MADELIVVFFLPLTHTVLVKNPNLLRQEVHDQPDHQLFMARLTLGGKQCQRHKGVIVDLGAACGVIQIAVRSEKQDKQKRPDSFVPIGKWMVLDYEIK